MLSETSKDRYKIYFLEASKILSLRSFLLEHENVTLYENVLELNLNTISMSVLSHRVHPVTVVNV